MARPSEGEVVLLDYVCNGFGNDLSVLESIEHTTFFRTRLIWNCLNIIMTVRSNIGRCFKEALNIWGKCYKIMSLGFRLLKEWVFETHFKNLRRRFNHCLKNL